MKALALSWGSSWRPPRLRPAIAVLILGSTLAGAAVLHGLHASPRICPRGFICAWGTGADPDNPPFPRQGWGDPWALAVCFVGFAGAAAVLLTPRRRAVAVLVLGVALAGAAILYFQNQLVSKNCPHPVSACSGPLQAGWFGGLVHFDDPAEVFHPAALAVGLLGAAGAAFVLLTARRPPANAALVLGAALLSAAILQVVGYPGSYVTCNSYYAGFRAGRPDCVQVEAVAGSIQRRSLFVY